MKLLDFLNYIQPELLVPFLASFRGFCGKKYWIYKAKIEIFSILDIYAHNFKSSGALENKYYATNKWLESGLQYQDSIEHNIRGYMESSNWRYMGGVEVLSDPGLARVKAVFRASINF